MWREAQVVWQEALVQAGDALRPHRLDQAINRPRIQRPFRSLDILAPQPRPDHIEWIHRHGDQQPRDKTGQDMI